MTARAPSAAATEAARSVWRQGRSVRPRMRCGAADPTVSAATSRPIASPRPSRNQVAAIFIAGGYVPARHTPVTKRSTSAGARCSTHSASTAFASAPASAPHIMSARAGTRSGRLVSAAARVPTMKPACTAMVRPARPPSPRPHSRERAGSTAEALNQSERASSSASDSRPSARQRPDAPSMTCASKHKSPRPARVDWLWAIV